MNETREVVELMVVRSSPHQGHERGDVVHIEDASGSAKGVQKREECLQDHQQLKLRDLGSSGAPQGEN